MSVVMSDVLGDVDACPPVPCYKRFPCIDSEMLVHVYLFLYVFIIKSTIFLFSELCHKVLSCNMCRTIYKYKSIKYKIIKYKVYFFFSSRCVCTNLNISKFSFTGTFSGRAYSVRESITTNREYDQIASLDVLRTIDVSILLSDGELSLSGSKFLSCKNLGSSTNNGSTKIGLSLSDSDRTPPLKQLTSTSRTGDNNDQKFNKDGTAQNKGERKSGV